LFQKSVDLAKLLNIRRATLGKDKRLAYKI